MNNQQPNLVQIESDDIDIIFRRIKIIFFFSLLQLMISGGLIYLNFGSIYYIIIESIFVLYSILLMYWAYDQNNKTIQSQQSHIETTNNFSTRFQLVFSVTITVLIIYTYMIFLLISLEQNQKSELFNLLIIIGFILQIIVQFVILITNSYFCKSPNVLRLAIYFQCLTISIIILFSWFKVYQVQNLPQQLQSADIWIDWNTLLQIPTLILVTITMLFNYVGNKKAYNIFGTLFLLLSILHTMIGCSIIRNAQYWIPSNEQLPLRALHEDIINNIGCKKYILSNNCPLEFKLEYWEQNNQITCLNEQCQIKAIQYIKNLQIFIGLMFLFEATILFINTYAMYTISVKYQINKLLNPLTQKILIIIYFTITITGVILLFTIQLPILNTQPSMNYKVEKDFIPQFNQLYINIYEQKKDCKKVGDIIPITEIQAINCESTCDDYEFLVGLSSENSQLQQLNTNSVKTFDQIYTNQFYKKNDFNQQIVIKGNKYQIINGLNNIEICSQNEQIDLIYEIEQKKQKNQRILQFYNFIQQNNLIDIELKFIDIQTNKEINKGNFRLFKQFIQCSNIKNQPYFEDSIQNNQIYNLKNGQQITIQFFQEKYFDFCQNYFVSNEQIIIYPLKRNKNLLNIIIKQQENKDKPVFLIANQNIGKQINCQVGGYFTGCSHIITKQSNTYSLLQFKEYTKNVIIFLQDYEQQNFNSLQLQLNIYSQDYQNIREINYKRSKILKLLCINKYGELNLIQQYDNESLLYPNNC